MLMPPRRVSLAELLRRNARFCRAGTVKMGRFLVLFPGNLNRIRPSALVPTFRGSHPVAAPIFANLGKLMGTSKLMILGPFFELKSWTNSPLAVQDFNSTALIASGQR